MTSATIIPIDFLSGRDLQIMHPQQIIVAKSFIKPGLKDSLENFILSSNKQKDREKALEILASIDDYNKRFCNNNNLVKEYKLKSTLQRPKSACTKLKDGSFINSFSTAYSEDYPKKPIKETIANRPPSTEHMIARPSTTSERNRKTEYSEDGPSEKILKSYSVYDQRTTYANDYCVEDPTGIKISPRSPNRAATASGERCNNPHPSKAFLVWRFPRESVNKTTRIPSATALKANMENNFAQITDEQFNRVMRGNCRSTYQSDFRGGAISNDQFSPFYLQPELKTGQKLKISTQRIDYGRPSSLPIELSVPKNRYSSNKVKSQQTKGIIPQVTNKTYMNTFTRTTYDEDINDRAKVMHGQIVDDIQKKVDLSRLHNMKDLERAMIETANITDQDTLQRVFQKLNEPESYKRISFVRKPFYHSDKMRWLSSYPGPL